MQEKEYPDNLTNGTRGGKKINRILFPAPPPTATKNKFPQLGGLHLLLGFQFPTFFFSFFWGGGGRGGNPRTSNSFLKKLRRHTKGLCKKKRVATFFFTKKREHFFFFFFCQIFLLNIVYAHASIHTEANLLSPTPSKSIPPLMEVLECLFPLLVDRQP